MTPFQATVTIAFHGTFLFTDQGIYVKKTDREDVANLQDRFDDLFETYKGTHVTPQELIAHVTQALGLPSNAATITELKQPKLKTLPAGTVY